jgi:hypothetical protein
MLIDVNLYGDVALVEARSHNKPRKRIGSHLIWFDAEVCREVHVTIIIIIMWKGITERMIAALAAPTF